MYMYIYVDIYTKLYIASYIDAAVHTLFYEVLVLTINRYKD